jgi:ankyrin repeat protein
VDIVEFILVKGTYFDLQDADTALMLAIHNNHRKTVKLLVEKVAQTGIQQAFMYASERGHKDIVEFLFEKGVHIDLQDDDGNTALMAAIQNDHRETVLLLLKKGAQTGIQNALIYASKRGFVEILEYLLDNGVQIDVQDDDGRTAFMVAVQSNVEVAVLFLLDRGAQLDLQDMDGCTALMLACKEGHSEIVKLLVSRGARLDLQDNNYNSAITWARICNHEDVFDFLYEYILIVEVNTLELCIRLCFE